MSKKRKTEGWEESNPGNVKKAKVMEVEFTGTQFKSMLKEPAKALKGKKTCTGGTRVRSASAPLLFSKFV